MSNEISHTLFFIASLHFAREKIGFLIPIFCYAKTQKLVEKMAGRRQRSAHARSSRILSDPQMSSLIRAHLLARWSPQLIARRLLTEHNMQVSNKTID